MPQNTLKKALSFFNCISHDLLQKAVPNGPRYISGVSIRNFQSHRFQIKRYQVKYSQDGKNWYPVEPEVSAYA